MKVVKRVKSISINKYEAFDGKCFDTEEECLQYEASITQKRNIVKNIENVECHIPFADWDMDPDTSKLYFIKNKEEFEALKEYYASECYDDTWWQDVKAYPVVYLVFAREGWASTYQISKHTIDGFNECINLINEYLCKGETLQ